MWQNLYSDYPQDTQTKNLHVEIGKGIVGCEMHEIAGWGEAHHPDPSDSPGMLSQFISRFSKKKGKTPESKPESKHDS